MMNTTRVLPFDLYHVDRFEAAVAWIILCVGLPAVCLACYALFRLVRADHVAPLYVINLLLSDLVQILARIYLISPSFQKHVTNQPEETRRVFLVIVRFGLVASLGFMVCISLERYIVVSHPLWYRYRRNIKYSVLISLAIWLFAVVYAAIDHHILTDYETFLLVFSTLFLIPFPLLVFFYVSTRTALSKTVSVSAAEKKRIIGALALVLGIYAVLYLPFTLMSYFLAFSHVRTYTVYCIMAVARSLVRLSPLVDPFLYIFMRKGARDTLEAFPCFRMIGKWSTTNSEEEGRNTAPTGSEVKSNC